jgi:hypothetical protein
MYPHRLVLDRVVLKAVLRREGMDSVIFYIQSSEQHFNEKKYVEFCAMARNTLQETVKNICLVVFGSDHGFSDNLRALENSGYLRSTISKQAKEFGGSLSAFGSHPPTESLSPDEAKFLLDSLYSIVGLLALRLTTFKKIEKS